VCGQTGIDGYEDYNALLAREDIGLVVILLPHSECPEAVERAAAAGKHVINETVDAILDGRTPGITGMDGLRAVEVVEAIYASAETGRVVTVGDCGA
jgi:predicted dehydrogenase